MTLSSTVTSKGQVTIPVEMRRALGVRPGDRLLFNIHAEGASITVLHRVKLSELAGSLPAGAAYAGTQAERTAVRADRGRLRGGKTS